MSLSQRQNTLKAIELFVLQREKKMKERFNLTSLLEGDWNLTQLHIVSLIKDNPSSTNNAFLANQLSLSKPAITKAMDALIEKGMVLAGYYSLTDSGQRLAQIHEEHHQKIIDRYDELLSEFKESELEVITRFLNAWGTFMGNPMIWDKKENTNKGGSIENQ